MFSAIVRKIQPYIVYIPLLLRPQEIMSFYEAFVDNFSGKVFQHDARSSPSPRNILHNSRHIGRHREDKHCLQISRR